MKTTVLIIIAAVLALAAGIMTRSHLASRASAPSMAMTLPDFSLPDSADKMHSIREWQGKLLVINFWATWCQPCRKEIPEFMALQKQYGSQGLQFIGIAIDDPEPVAEFLAETKINYPALISGINGIALAQSLGNTLDAVPFTVVVNTEGQIIHQHPGAFKKEQILAVIQPLLNKQ